MKRMMIADTDTLHENFGSLVNGSVRGLIHLPVPVADITKWYRRPLALPTLTGLSKENTERLLYYAGWLVTDPKDTGLAADTVLTNKEMEDARAAYGKGFDALQGPEALLAAAKKIDYEGLEKDICREKNETMAELESLFDGNEIRDYERYEAMASRLSVLDAKADALQDQRAIIKSIHFSVIALFPLDLRAAVGKSIGSVPYGVYDDLEELCGSVVSRAERIRRLMDLDAPDIIMCNEKRLLQEAVDSLFANGLRGKPKTKRGTDIPLCSLADILFFQTAFH